MPERSGLPLWAKGVLPLLLLAGLLIGFLKLGPVGVFRRAFPPVEELTVDRITLPAPYQMEVRVVNGGPEPVTIAQVMVDDANWVFGMRRSTGWRAGSSGFPIPGSRGSRTS
jgi:zinc transporter, ZIP family